MDSHLQKYNWTSPSLSPYTKLNFRLIQLFNIINENFQVLEENIEDIFNICLE